MCQPPRRAVFLDRDGTLNQDQGYVHRSEDWVWLGRAPEAIATFNRLGLLTVVVSNQSGVGRGYYGVEEIERLHRYVQESLSRWDARIDGFLYCPHAPDPLGQPVCSCRKPRPGLIHRASSRWNIDLDRSFLVGDKASDIGAGRAAGVDSFLVLTGRGRTERGRIPGDVRVVRNLEDAAEAIEDGLDDGGVRCPSTGV